MAEEAQNRIQKAIGNFVDEIDKSRLRRLQYDMHTCAATCCADQISSIDQVQRCVENCSRDMTQAQNLVQNELGQFQERLQRGVLLCQDRIKEKVGPNPTEAEFRRYKGEFENCAVECVNYHLGQLPSLMEKLKKALN